ncbi:MAG TPA: hypothetical protein VFS25_22835 [Chitinophaga sp.]|uniref:hypothetical protein n=1 Tax=Chitinophaga sp. TaxID=1869181 RepID=UPI002DBF52C1|nr:hypothetical protein [Chitinophaga sp.]HEU4555700.1 hypothetical protein [Chitinophaga sp.]
MDQHFTYRSPVSSRAAANHSASSGISKRAPVPVQMLPGSEPVVQRRIMVGKEQLDYPDAETAFHALRSTFSQANGRRLYNVLLQLNADNMQYHNFISLKSDVERQISTTGPAPAMDIENVMAKDNLAEFTAAQDKFQIGLTSMDGLQSAGFEFEFASFKKTPAAEYTKEEIIPSHQLMGSAMKMGDYFNLAWRLESDSYNTLELVTPPFVFPKTSEGSGKLRSTKELINHTLAALADQLGTTATLPETAGRLTAAGLGNGWQIQGAYKNFGVTKNAKSGGKVYDQMNISMFPEEIGAMLEERFSKFDIHSSGSYVNGLPENTARRIREAFGQVGGNIPTAVTNAIAVFSRYASNAVAIPSMRHRQDTGQRKDTTPTDVKETLGIWVKTDALNLIRPILSTPTDMELFCQTLVKAREGILNIFRTEGARMIRAEEPPPVMMPPTSSGGGLTLLDAIKQVMSQHQLQKGDPRIMPLAKKLQAQSTNNTQPQAPQQPSEAPAVTKMKEYVELMLAETAAFIQRALEVGTHVEKAPGSTTSEFLEERYGTGEGVRKGTYLKNVPTTAGAMYVTEIRDQQ